MFAKQSATALAMVAVIGLSMVGAPTSSGAAPNACDCVECRCPDCNGELCACDACECGECGCLR